MKQYWIQVKYNGVVGCTNPLWELTQGRFPDEAAVRSAYEARAKSLDHEILEVTPYEPAPVQFRYEDATTELEDK